MTRSRSRYAGYDVLEKWGSPDWDDQTREVVRQRLDEVPPVRFFTPEEARLLEAVCDRIVPRAERGQRVAVVPWIDEKLFDDRRDGYRYEDVPPLRQAWRVGLAGIDESARLLHGGRAFPELAADEQDDLLRRVARGDAPGAAWARLSPVRFFRDVLCLTAVKIYYAHPRAWSEIGYSGPSSPRGHVRNWMGGVDPWDAHETDT
jgi:Gluconate 2-dehydrogenase subunit 3